MITSVAAGSHIVDPAVPYIQTQCQSEPVEDLYAGLIGFSPLLVLSPQVFGRSARQLTHPATLRWRPSLLRKEGKEKKEKNLFPLTERGWSSEAKTG